MTNGTGCAVPDAARIRDKWAEQVVLCGLMRYGRYCLRHLGDASRGLFYYDHHGELFDVLCYLANGDTEGPLMVDAVDEYVLRGSDPDTMTFVELWMCDPWFMGISDWTDPGGDLPLRVWAAVAAAAKLRHLAARRHAVYAAQELIRDALDPTGDAAYIRGRTDRLTEEY